MKSYALKTNILKIRKKSSFFYSMIEEQLSVVENNFSGIKSQ